MNHLFVELVAPENDITLSPLSPPYAHFDLELAAFDLDEIP